MPDEPEADRPDQSSTQSYPESISFHYIKSPTFRSIHVDGAFGGPTLNGRYVRMAVYNERSPLPRKTVHHAKVVGGEPTYGEESRAERDVRDGFVRELDADLIMDLDTALVIWQWLGDKLLKMGRLKLPDEEPKNDSDAK